MRRTGSNSGLRLSRAISDRVLLGVLALTMAIFFGVGCWFAFFQSRPPVDVLETIVRFVIDDALLAVFILCTLALVWAVVAPRCMEQLLERRALTAYFAVIVALLVAGIFLWLR